ncbi:hypothetical protein MBLNU230_g4334t1 [Neophaeotheca triangularis]
MAYAPPPPPPPPPRFGYRQQSISDNTTSLDSKRQPQPAYFEPDSAVLDPAILDADIMQSPNNNTNFRKDSFANSNGVLSPPVESQPWNHQYGTGLPLDPTAVGAANPYAHGENHGLVRPSSSLPPGPYAQQQQQQQQQHHHHHHHHSGQQQSWTFDHPSGHCTPSTDAQFMPPPPQQFEAPPFDHRRADSAHGNFSHGPPVAQFVGSHAENGFIPAPQVQTPMSPHSHQDYMALAHQEMLDRPMPKRMRPNSPSQTFIGLDRRDGIRKKNGRIDIPQERNIHTIDQLIERTTDEDALRELKQQKRLLRNREAALASRQRKKKHTEDLEIKEKGFATQINMLEKDLANLTIERNQIDHDYQLLYHKHQEAQRTIEVMHDEKRDLVMKHTEETSSLRKKIQVLSDQLDAGPAPAMSAAPSSTGFTDFNAEMEALNMGPHDWDNFIFVNDLQNDSPHDFSFDPHSEPIKQSPALEKKTSSATVVPICTSKKTDNATDQPIASGLLFMLLLCGAWMASKPISSVPADLPQMPPDVRAAAPAVLNNLLSEAGASSANQRQHHQQQHPSRSAGFADQEPTLSHPLPTHSRANTNRMDHMHSRLTAQTRQQKIDDAFSLTPAQYASLTDTSYPQQQHYDTGSGVEPAASSRPQRRSLAEAIMAENQHGSGAGSEQQHKSKAEVYTRSLLWDQIPEHVVKQFRELVRDREQLEARQQQQQQPQRHVQGHVPGFSGYKIES